MEVDLEQARIIALECARDSLRRGNVKGHSDWEELSAEKDSDHYYVRLSFRPVPMVFGRPGVELFVISKSGAVETRKVLRRPLTPRAGLATVVLIALAGIALTGILSSWATANAQPQTAPQEPAWTWVSPDRGTLFSSPLGHVKLEIESGSVAADGVVSYTNWSAWDIPDLPLGFVATTKVFDLSIAANGGLPTGSMPLLRSGRLTISLSPAEIEIAGSRERNFVIHHLDPVKGAWDPLVTSADFNSGETQSTVASLGVFALAVRWPGQPPLSSQTHRPGAGNPPLDRAAKDRVISPRPNSSFELAQPRPTTTVQARPHWQTETPLYPARQLMKEQPLPSRVPVPTPTAVSRLKATVTPSSSLGLTPTETPSPDSARPISPVHPTRPPTFTPSPTPILTKDWKLEGVYARNDVIRVYLKLLGPGLVAVSVDGLETEEIKTVLPYQLHVFRGVSPGTHTVKTWTPGVGLYDTKRKVEVYEPTPTPPSSLTSHPRPAPTPEPRYRLFINRVQVPAQNLLVFVGDGAVTLSMAPAPDGRYDQGDMVVILVSPKPGWPLAWGGVDSYDGFFAKVHMVADRFVSIKIGPPPPTPILVFKTSRNRGSRQNQALEAVPRPTSIPTPVPTPEPTQLPTPEPTPGPTQPPTPEPTPEPTQPPTPEPTPGPTQPPTPEPTPEPTQLPTPEPTPEPTQPPTAEPTPEPPSGLEGRIVFASNRDGDFDIYAMDVDGSDLTLLTDNPADDRHPVWSPDGTKIAFQSQRDGNWEIYVMNSDGSLVTRLISNPREDVHPAWSSDGTEIAFESNRDGHRELYAMFSDGLRQMNISKSSDDETSPDWSPDGTRIAFNRPGDNGYDLHTMDVGSWGIAHQLLTGVGARRPRWSPNGAKLAVTGLTAGEPNVSTINADGTGLLSLTPEHSAWSPSWSPDGAQLVYVSNKEGDPELYVMNADGTSHVRVTHVAGVDADPDWKP